MKPIELTSSAFSDQAGIPARYLSARAGGENISPPLTWSGTPEAALSLALTVVDLAPVAHMWVHWAVVDIPPSVSSLPEGASGAGIPPGARELRNTAYTIGWSGPKPPPGTGEHPYVFTVYALDIERLELPAQPTAQQIEQAVRGHVLGQGSLTGLCGT